MHISNNDFVSLPGVHCSQTGRYSTGTCRMSGQTNAEINNGSCRQTQQPVRHVRGSVSKDGSSLDRHGTTKCAGLRFVCPQCQCSLSSLGGLTQHVKHVHQKLTSYRCEHCGKGYSHRINYLDHLATHIGVKRYICSICQQQFTLKCTCYDFIASEADPSVTGTHEVHCV